MLLDVVRARPWKLAVLAGLVMAFALALPDGTGATSINEVMKLLASDAQADDQFGRSVAVSGDTAVVGAFRGNIAGDFAGVAYLFQRNGGGAGTWDEVKKLTASDAASGDGFGYSVAVSGDTAVVGAYQECCRQRLLGRGADSRYAAGNHRDE